MQKREQRVKRRNAGGTASTHHAACSRPLHKRPCRLAARANERFYNSMQSPPEGPFELSFSPFLSPAFLFRFSPFNHSPFFGPRMFLSLARGPVVRARTTISPLLSFLPSPNGRIYIPAKKSSLFASRDIRRVFERRSAQGFEIAGRLSTSSKRCRGRRVSLNDRIFPPLEISSRLQCKIRRVSSRWKSCTARRTSIIRIFSFSSLLRESNRTKQCNRRWLTFHATSSRGGNRVA